VSHANLDTSHQTEHRAVLAQLVKKQTHESLPASSVHHVQKTYSVLATALCVLRVHLVGSLMSNTMGAMTACPGSLALMGFAIHARRVRNQTPHHIAALTASKALGLSAWMAYNAARVKPVNSPMLAVRSVTRVTLGDTVLKEYRVGFATWALNPMTLASVLPRVSHALVGSALEMGKVATSVQPEVNPTLQQLAVNFVPSAHTAPRVYVLRVH